MNRKLKEPKRIYSNYEGYPQCHRSIRKPPSFLSKETAIDEHFRILAILERPWDLTQKYFIDKSRFNVGTNGQDLLSKPEQKYIDMLNSALLDELSIAFTRIDAPQFTTSESVIVI